MVVNYNYFHFNYYFEYNTNWKQVTFIRADMMPILLDHEILLKGFNYTTLNNKQTLKNKRNMSTILMKSTAQDFLIK